MNGYIIYGKPDCEYCTEAINLFTTRGMKYESVNISELEGMELSVLQDIAGIVFNSVPQIFAVDKESQLTYVGSYTNLKSVIENLPLKKEAYMNEVLEYHKKQAEALAASAKAIKELMDARG